MSFNEIGVSTSCCMLISTSDVYLTRRLLQSRFGFDRLDYPIKATFCFHPPISQSSRAKMCMKLHPFSSCIAIAVRRVSSESCTSPSSPSVHPGPRIMADF